MHNGQWTQYRRKETTIIQPAISSSPREKQGLFMTCLLPLFFSTRFFFLLLFPRFAFVRLLAFCHTHQLQPPYVFAAPCFWGPLPSNGETAFNDRADGYKNRQLSMLLGRQISGLGLAWISRALRDSPPPLALGTAESVPCLPCKPQVHVNLFHKDTCCTRAPWCNHSTTSSLDSLAALMEPKPWWLKADEAPKKPQRPRALAKRN